MVFGYLQINKVINSSFEVASEPIVAFYYK